MLREHKQPFKQLKENQQELQMQKQPFVQQEKQLEILELK